eukprot:gene55445-24935_t
MLFTPFPPVSPSAAGAAGGARVCDGLRATRRRCPWALQRQIIIRAQRGGMRSTTAARRRKEEMLYSATENPVEGELPRGAPTHSDRRELLGGMGDDVPAVVVPAAVGQPAKRPRLTARAGINADNVRPEFRVGGGAAAPIPGGGHIVELIQPPGPDT